MMVVGSDLHEQAEAVVRRHAEDVTAEFLRLLRRERWLASVALRRRAAARVAEKLTPRRAGEAPPIAQKGAA